MANNTSATHENCIAHEHHVDRINAFASTLYTAETGLIDRMKQNEANTEKNTDWRLFWQGVNGKIFASVGISVIGGLFSLLFWIVNLLKVAG